MRIHGGFYTSDDRITSPYSAESLPGGPLHDDKTFPTPTNTSEQMAYDLCLGEINKTELYEICLNLTGNDTEHYVTSCVEDIKVTVCVCHNVVC